MVAKKDFATVLDAFGGQWFSSHLPQFDPGKEYLSLLNRWLGRSNS